MQDGPAVLETAYNSMVELLRARAAEQPDERAYVFLSDRGGEEASLTFSELQRRAAVCAVSGGRQHGFDSLTDDQLARGWPQLDGARAGPASPRPRPRPD